ncbi:hypothetical protein TEA_003640 [Camellia sinensis var. sinensis]|uniref:Uncharacterized protein n=1 Tax=Camellia sinensis var. sinensis TaxID=542762 RepID=A0A4S4E316_CAMSN|nr:hypothetical protein TEA_003640 [Camellia sinensis var. sinensis]
MASNRDEPLTFMNPSSTSSPIAVSDGDSFLLDPNSQIGSASGSFNNEGFLVLDGGGDLEFGFFRTEFRQSPLILKETGLWVLFVGLIISAGLVEYIVIRNGRLTHFDIDTFVEEVLVKDGEWPPGTPEALRGFYIFVCAHGTRDRRCGVCGPAVITRFKEEIESYGLQSKVSVSPCSHIGEHKYAGNVIIFGAKIGGEVTGHWYGYVTPDDVPLLLEQHIGKGEIVDWLWRGQMGLSEEDQKTSQELRLQLNKEANVGSSSKEPTQTNEISSAVCGSQVAGMGCFRANGNSPCCQNPSVPEKIDNANLNKREAKLTAEKKSTKRQISRKNSGKAASTRRMCTMPTWLESWEREDTYAALAVIGAAMSVAVAYNCYKQLR